MEVAVFEPWSEVRLERVAEADNQPQGMLQECAVTDTATAETNAARTVAVWFGVATEWSATDVRRLYVCDLQQAKVWNAERAVTAGGWRHIVRAPLRCQLGRGCSKEDRNPDGTDYLVP
jgi:hypothetical protein